MLHPRRPPIAAATACVLFLCGLLASGQDSNLEKTPASGDWKGFRPGTYIIQKVTHWAASDHQDRVTYRKTVLGKVDQSGAGHFQGYTANAPEGPWTMNGGVHGGSLGERIDRKTLPEETIKIADGTFPCTVVVTSRKSDWDNTTTKEWIDKGSGLPMREESVGERRDGIGQPTQWKSRLSTAAVEKRVVKGRELSCFVQESEDSERGWYRTFATSEVPGHKIALFSAKAKAAAIDYEWELLDWGYDPALMADLKKNSVLFSQERRQQAEAQRKQKSRDQQNQMVVALAGGDASKFLSRMDGTAMWANGLEPETKKAAVAAFRNALDDPAARIRRLAGLELGHLGVKGLSSRIIELLRKDPDGADQYLGALGLQADDEASSAILPFTSHAQPSLRKAAVAALSNFRTAVAREAVEKALTDPAWEVRQEGVDALGKMANPLSTPALLRALHDDNPLVVENAIPVVCQLDGDAAVPSLLELLKSPNEQVRDSVWTYIGEMRLESSRPVSDALLPLLDDPSAQIRQAAVGALGRLREKRAVPKLIRILKEPDKPNVGFPLIWPQAAAAVALGEIGDPSALPALIGALDDPTAKSNPGLIPEAIVKIGDPSGARALFQHYVKTAADGDLRVVHIEELKAIGQLGSAETRAELEAYLAQCPPPQMPGIRGAIKAIDERTKRP